MHALATTPLIIDKRPIVRRKGEGLSYRRPRGVWEPRRHSKYKVHQNVHFKKFKNVLSWGPRENVFPRLCCGSRRGPVNDRIDIVNKLNAEIKAANAKFFLLYNVD